MPAFAGHRQAFYFSEAVALLRTKTALPEADYALRFEDMPGPQAAAKWFVPIQPSLRASSRIAYSYRCAVTYVTGP
ncbi:hypothetical protein GCM10007094_39320 [Pseudovibrio japonicus]|uniref:Uncharacterized protein n=1 Tax=Pseudovibrio japonicus TaxID=366534 RepID=A0ABQ3EQJ4_9HYPH|nr:hypothetical protein GCM10007094_39320 [Pseudovibrio japonicus]